MAKFIKYKWRIYADNNMSRDVVEHLRISSMDVLWVAEVSALRHREDRFHYEKARQMGRYLLTNDIGFWNDKKYPVKDSPGVILLMTEDSSIKKYLPILLRKLVTDYNPLTEPLYLQGSKIKISGGSLTIRIINSDSNKVSTETWKLKDLV